MQHFDLLLAWNWEYDRDFIGLLGTACASHGLTFLPVGIDNLETVLGGLQGGELTISTFMDRASDTDPCFLGLMDLICNKEIYQINPHDLATWSTDKATMHLEFISRGLDTPYTILLPPVCEQPDLPILELHPLGERFAVKPAHLGGGEGVVLDVTNMEEVLSIRKQHPGEKYLLQAQVTPQVLGGRPAWFRVLVCSGAVYPCWWDPRRHVYSRLSAHERAAQGLRSLYEVALRIAQVCRLQLFSTEIALSPDGRFQVVDYVNDPVDLRLQSQALDGVPDAIVEDIAARLARLAAAHSRFPVLR